MNSSDNRQIRALPPLLVVVYLFVTGFGLNHYPLVWVDEGWIAEVAAQAARGLPLGSPSHGTLYQYSDRLFWMPPLYFYELGGLFRVAGIDLLTGRWFNVFVGGLSTLALFFFLRRRTGSWAAWFAALFFACDTFVWKSHRTIRFESLLTLFGILLVIATTAALEREDDDRPTRGAWFAAGLAAGLLVNVHPNALVWLAAVFAMALVQRGRRLFRTGGAWLALTVAFLMALPYLLYLGTDSAHGFANVIGQNSYHLEHGAAEGWAPLREWRRWADFFVMPARLPALLAWAAIVWMAFRMVGRGGSAPDSRNMPDTDEATARRLAPYLAALGTYVTLLAFLPNKTLLYLGGAAPFVAILGALAWHGAGGRGVAGDAGAVRSAGADGVAAAPVGRGTLVVRAALVAGVLASLVVNAAILWRARDCWATEDLAAIRAVLQPDDRVAGTFVTWWATQPASAAEPPRPFHEFSRGATREAVAHFAPTVIVLGDRQWEQEVPTRFGPLDRELVAPGGPLDGREPALSLPGSCLGPVRVYAVRPVPPSRPVPPATGGDAGGAAGD
jgi:4-amino-4-deoxy-L-arabinose transferase-like glycosyltransferase